LKRTIDKLREHIRDQKYLISVHAIMSPENCEFCDGAVEPAITRIPFHYLRQVIYVDNVPVRQCRKCGEIYFEASVYEQLEKIAKGRRQIKNKVSFPPADYVKSTALTA
jgi:YgiT-type zinc finger domain-containing protein